VTLLYLNLSSIRHNGCLPKENDTFSFVIELLIVDLSKNLSGRCCRDLLLAGTDTTSMSVSWAILHMIHKPEIQETMYQEIKDVIGLDRFPDMKDRTNMPYCDAVCTETMRISNASLNY
jgi:hypothetical protein